MFKKRGRAITSSNSSFSLIREDNMDFIKENPMMGNDYWIKVTMDIEASENGFKGEVEVNYAPDKSIIDNLVLVKTVRAIVIDVVSEEETIQKVGDLLVELLKPFQLYVKMKLEYSKEQYKVEVNYEFNKTETYKIRRD